MMRLGNVLLFVLPILIALLLTLVFSVYSPWAVVSFLVILDMVISFLIMILFFHYGRLSMPYENLVLNNSMKTGATGKYRVAVVIPVYNEPPDIVVETATSAIMAVEGQGDVYVLDDSTDKRIREELDYYSKQLGFRIFRRGSRRGYKAGALNDWLSRYGKDYDVLIIVDADQMLLPGILNHTLKFFDDPDVAFVQVPQYYSNLDRAIPLSAWIQQVPFLRVVMRGRSLRGSAFSLGSGTIFRISHLLSVGGFDENTVTEDVATSVRLHSKGLKSVYIDLPLVWNGEPPRDLPSYLSQQNRWSLGSFQLVRKLLSARLSASALLDYAQGFYYWLHVGPLSIVDVVAPVLFLVFGIVFIRANALYYLIVYLPIFISSVILYLMIMRRYGYGLREFVYHQGIQFIVSLPVTTAFFEWVIGKRKGFKVTPKGKEAVSFTDYNLYYILMAVLSAIALAIGAYKLPRAANVLFYAYIINMFWEGWWFFILISSSYISLNPRVSHKSASKVAQSYEGLRQVVLSLIPCGITLEKAIADHYLKLARISTEYSRQLEEIAADSYEHAEIYTKLQSELVGESITADCSLLRSVFNEVSMASRADGDLRRAIIVPEEVMMRVFAKMILETSKYLVRNVDDLYEIINDEKEHERILTEIIKELEGKV